MRKTSIRIPQNVFGDCRFLNGVNVIYLSKITLSESRKDCWPYSMDIIKNLRSLEFSDPVTFIVGENGAGKSTLIETLAIKLKMPSIGRVDATYDESIKDLRALAGSFRLTMHGTPRNKLFLRSEDFFNFVLKINREQQELADELKRVELEYKDKSEFTKNQARQAYVGSSYQMKNKYGEDMLKAASHGESFIRLFLSRITPNGLYILDEPANPLSPLRQLTLLHIIKEMSEQHNCQFIIATHSPILLAYNNAGIYSLDGGTIEKSKWQDLESIQLLRDFLNQPGRYVDKL